MTLRHWICFGSLFCSRLFCNRKNRAPTTVSCWNTRKGGENMFLRLKCNLTNRSSGAWYQILLSSWAVNRPLFTSFCLTLKPPRLASTTTPCSAKSWNYPRLQKIFFVARQSVVFCKELVTSETEPWSDAEDWTSHHSTLADHSVLPLLALPGMKACRHLELTKSKKPTVQTW